MADDKVAPDGDPAAQTDETTGVPVSTCTDFEFYREPETTSNETAQSVETVQSDDRVIGHLRLVLVGGLAVLVALTGLTGWLGFRTYQAAQTQHLQQLLIQAGRQGATNLTSIDYEHAEADVQRILDSSTDAFYDDFAKRAEPFAATVKQTQSKSVGTVSEAGLESMTGDEGQVLVAITVKTSNRGAEQPLRAWRMRMTVKKVSDNEAKVSKVEFIS